MHFHALASFQQGVNINSVHRPCHMLELPRGNPLHTFSYPLCYQPTLFEIPTSAINQVLLIASFSYHQLLLTFPSGWCAYFLALLSIFANAGILEHKGSPNGTNLELTQDHVLQARMLWIFNRRDRCCKKVHCVFFCLFFVFFSFFVFFVFLYWSGKCRCRFRKCTILYKNLTSHVSVCTDPAHLSERPNKEIMEKN